MNVACQSTMHRHIQTCARCGVSDLSVAATVTTAGKRWPPLCAQCVAKVLRIRAVERAVSGEVVPAA